MSEFRLQVVHAKDGRIVAWQPGREVEIDLVEELCARVAAKGVGVGRTTAHVVADVRAAMTEMLFALKARV